MVLGPEGNKDSWLPSPGSGGGPGGWAPGGEGGPGLRFPADEEPESRRCPASSRVLGSGLGEDPGQRAHLGDRAGSPLPTPEGDRGPQRGSPAPCPPSRTRQSPGSRGPRGCGNQTPPAGSRAGAGGRGRRGFNPIHVRDGPLCGRFRCPPRRRRRRQGPQPFPRRDRDRGAETEGHPPPAPQAPRSGAGVPAGGGVRPARGCPLSPVRSGARAEGRRDGRAEGRQDGTPTPAQLTWAAASRRLRSDAGATEPGAARAPAPPPSPPPAPSAPRPGRLTIKGEAWGRGPGAPAGRKPPPTCPPTWLASPRAALSPSLCSRDPSSLPRAQAWRGGLPHCPPRVPCAPRVVSTLPLPTSLGPVTLPAQHGGGGAYPSVWPGIPQVPKSQVMGSQGHSLTPEALGSHSIFLSLSVSVCKTGVRLPFRVRLRTEDASGSQENAESGHHMRGVGPRGSHLDVLS